MTVTLTAPRMTVEARPIASATESVPDIVEVWGLDSFPASDAPANW